MSLTLPKWVQPSLVVLALLGGYVWLKFHDARIRRETVQTLQVDSLNRVIDSSRVLNQRLLEENRHASDSIVVLSKKVGTLAQTARVLRTQADSLSEVLGSQLPDSLLPAFAQVTQKYREVIATKDSIISVYAATVSLQATQLRNDSTIISGYQSQLQKAIEQRDAFHSQATPGLVKQAVRILPWVAGAYVVGRVTR